MKAIMMDAQTIKAIKELFTKIIERNVSPDAFTWLHDKANQSAGANNNYQLNLSFTAIPRKTGKKEIVLEESDTNQIHKLFPGFSFQHWTIDRLSRVWLLMQLVSDDRASYISRIENLFLQAEMNEQVALYSSLPFLAYPESWKLRCAEGIRSNIGTVLEAIMYYNPYPAQYLDEPAWNQLIMKAFFTDKKVNLITGLDERANQNLANILFDYVEERWAAHRIVNPQIWRLAGPFLDADHFYMMEKLFEDGNETDKQAAALACNNSQFEKAKLLINRYAEYKTAIDENVLSWKVLASKE
jgi:hypothetical protein